MTRYDTRMKLRIARRAAAPETLAGELHPVLRRIYGARGVRSALELDLSLSRLLPVSSLVGVEAAVELLLGHRAQGRVVIVGDFDADGATSTALMVRALRAWGFAHVDFLVPNRFAFGYGLSPEIVALAAQRSPTLLVTVDNGMSSLAGVAAARSRGIDVLITDHHLPAAQMPDANVIVNPNAALGTPGARCLAGVGVAFYILAALRRRMDDAGLTPPGAVGPAEFLDLVALGTVADLVPLDANNRVLIAQGLRRIRAGRCVAGIRCLLDVAGRDREETSASDLAYAVAPRINAAGRLDDMTIGIQCLLADDVRDATPLAARLDQLNDERRAIEARMQAEALAAVRGLRDPLDGASRHGVCLFDAGWHQGVVGLVAGRVKERIRRPVIAFATADDGSLRGSARSVAGVHIRDVLDAIAAREAGLIVRFGGHAMAAGLTLERAHLDRFARAFDAEVGRWMGAVANLDSIETDGELALDEICLDTANALRSAGPWGQAFPEPCFDGLFTLRAPRLVGDRHVKMWVDVPGTGRAFDAIAFNHAEHPDATLPQAGDARLVYRLDINAYQGERRLQLVVDHVLPASVTVS
jgi:single-stranded-DNA-specific exonuclease